MSTPSTARRNALAGAAFLMATSAVGPGFLTQTSLFTSQLAASFGFAILISILVDLGAQLTIWRVVAVTRRRAQDLANAVMPGLGVVLAALICLGGFAFNIGNVAGAGLGLEVMTGMSVKTGAALSAAIAIAIFLVREAGRAVDRFALVMGFVMVALTLFVAVASDPPVAEAALRSVWPARIDVLAIVTLVGGTVGGYISFAGAHRLLDAGVSGMDALPQVDRSAATAIGVASLMRVLLFLAALGVVSRGGVLDPGNPAASVFRLAVGEAGYKLFGLVMWAAALTSVVGSAYTSVSFLKGLVPSADRHATRWTVGFIGVSTLVFLTIGRPVAVLVAAGALNGLILPVSLGSMLLVTRRPELVGGYRHPGWLLWAGVIVVVAMTAMGATTLATELPKLFR
ncbi:MAG: NRAMP family divalent metal transporter [Gemmatimonadota bacterium]|nr:NRAMP family divalent metal transporter [Gemmatimonadota bacterium]